MLPLHIQHRLQVEDEARSKRWALDDLARAVRKVGRAFASLSRDESHISKTRMKKIVMHLNEAAILILDAPLRK